jgi:hypothetical protein
VVAENEETCPDDKINSAKAASWLLMEGFFEADPTGLATLIKSSMIPRKQRYKQGRSFGTRLSLAQLSRLPCLRANLQHNSCEAEEFQSLR